jgi:hypothetical protein
MRKRTIEYVAQQLVHGYKDGNNITQAFLNKYDFYIFPFVNPDGKVALIERWKHLLTTDRLHLQSDN